MHRIRGGGCWSGRAEGTVIWFDARTEGPEEPAPDRATAIRRYLSEVERSAVELERCRDRQETLGGRVLCQEYLEALTTDAWSRRTCALIDSGRPAGTAAVEAGRELSVIMARSDELRERAARLGEVAGWVAFRLRTASWPAGAVLAAATLSPLQLLTRSRPALLSGPEPAVPAGLAVRTGTVPLVWSVPGLGPDWHGLYARIHDTNLTLSDISQEDRTMQYAEIREAICETARRMLKDGLVRLTSGNVSCRIPGHDLFAITPSGMDYESLRPEDICIVDLSGRVVDGERRPSSEMPMHRHTYAARPDVGGIVHTHSIYASAFACLGREMPVISTELAGLVGGTIRCAPYARAGTEDFARVAVETLGSESLAVLFQNHGVMAAGRTLKEAYHIAVGLEEAAMIYSLARQMGDPIIIPADERERMFREFRTSYGQPAAKPASQG